MKSTKIKREQSHFVLENTRTLSCHFISSKFNIFLIDLHYLAVMVNKGNDVLGLNTL